MSQYFFSLTDPTLSTVLSVCGGSVLVLSLGLCCATQYVSFFICLKLCDVKTLNCVMSAVMNYLMS